MNVGTIQHICTMVTMRVGRSPKMQETLPKDVLYALDSSQGAGPMSATQNLLQLPFRCCDRRCGRMERGMGMASLLGRGWDTTSRQSINRPVDLPNKVFPMVFLWSSEMVDFHRTELEIYVKRAPPSRHASSLARKPTVRNSLREESWDTTATILQPSNSERHNQQTTNQQRG